MSRIDISSVLVYNRKENTDPDLYICNAADRVCIRGALSLYIDKKCDRSYDDILDKVKRVHFIGIGGSGMCPLAEILIAKGYEVSGSDMNDGDTLQRIISYGVPVFMGHKAENIKGAELVVYTAAVKQDNPELAAARENDIPTIERSVMLGILSRIYNCTVAVSGTHGKTTTTAMISQTLIGSGFEPTAVIGGKLPAIGGNSHVGSSDIMVCEACEYVDSFLQITPAVAVVLNVDADHLDYFENLDNIKKSFAKFTDQTSREVIVNGDDQKSLDSVKDSPVPIITFGFGEGCDYRAVMTSPETTVYDAFDFYLKDEKLCNIELSVPGKHNVYNALAAAAACHRLGVNPEDISKNLNDFRGVHRRFEILGKHCGITVADDFAHHPTEIKAALTAAMNMGFHKVWNVFQPHTFSRTAMLLDDFADALSIVDEAVILEILPVREVNTYNIYNTDLGKRVKGSKCIDTFEEAARYVCENAQSGDLILTMGGGNVYMCANMINKMLADKESAE